MKLLRRGPELLAFQLRQREKPMLLAVLARYPCIPAGWQRLSRHSHDDAAAENQQMLEEALAVRRAENRRRLAAFMEAPGRFAELKGGWKLTLKLAEADWLLQVLNDVRVGSWLALGEPDFEAGAAVPLNDETGPRLWAMESAAYFEHHLLEALNGPGNEPSQ